MSFSLCSTPRRGLHADDNENSPRSATNWSEAKKQKLKQGAQAHPEKVPSPMDIDDEGKDVNA